MISISKIGTRIVVGLVLIVVLGLATVGGLSSYRWCRDYWSRTHASVVSAGEKPVEAIPVSKRPGPPRDVDPPSFVLTPTNALTMIGMDDPLQERWCDIGGNFYSAGFVSRFSYANPCARNPHVLVQVEPRADTLRGRLEARHLKPNFAYQLKLRGVFSDRSSFEAIGHVGRWRLPGRGTNYADQDYLEYEDKAAVESYILFDFFVTDGRGDAVRPFALDSSLHVLWNASRQGGEPEMNDLCRIVAVPNDPEAYSRPKLRGTIEWLWAEREIVRYTNRDQIIRLPPGNYSAELVLTEESFHSHENDGGFWATVYRCPVSFTVNQ